MHPFNNNLLDIIIKQNTTSYRLYLSYLYYVTYIFVKTDIITVMSTQYTYTS